MNYNIACNILNLPPQFTHSELKKKYHIMALQYHPDKNNSSDADDIFKQIVEAYNYLNSYYSKNNYFYQDINIDENNIDENNTDENIDNEILYSKLIMDFINIISSYDSNFLKIFKNDCLEYSLSIINTLEKPILLILSNYINILYILFNISKESLECIIYAIKNRLQVENVYILNPSLKNIKNNQIHCLKHDEEIIYIPLWHKELVYNNITIKCIPDLPKNIEIDDNNNIHYKIFIDLQDIFNNNNIEIIICDDIYYIPIEKLYIKKYQTYVLKENGISLINTTNILDIDKKSDIIAHIFINNNK